MRLPSGYFGNKLFMLMFAFLVENYFSMLDFSLLVMAFIVLYAFSFSIEDSSSLTLITDTSGYNAFKLQKKSSLLLHSYLFLQINLLIMF